MQLQFKVPKLIKSRFTGKNGEDLYDLAFTQLAFHTDEGDFIRAVKINDEILGKIKALPYPRQVMVEQIIAEVSDTPYNSKEEFRIGYKPGFCDIVVHDDGDNGNSNIHTLTICTEQDMEVNGAYKNINELRFMGTQERIGFCECMKKYLKECGYIQ